MEELMDDRDRRQPAAPPAIRRAGGGYAVEGPGFYVWDEDAERVRCAARALCAGRIPQATTRRLLVVEPEGRGTTPRER